MPVPGLPEVILAAGDPATPSYMLNIPEIISNFGPVGVLVWYIWYTTSIILPRLYSYVQENNREMAALSRQMMEILEKINAEHANTTQRVANVLERLERCIQRLSDEEGEPKATEKGQREIISSLHEIHDTIQKLKEVRRR